MSLDVALQSVAFYILSCSTCAKINHRRRAKSKAKRERAAKDVLKAEHPELYHHPSPFSTNQYWAEDIMMGPGNPKKNDRGASRNITRRATDSPGQESVSGGSTTLKSEAPSSPTAVTEGSRISGDGWNIQRYQREDEDLWGYDAPKPGQIIMDAVVKAGCAAGRLLEGSLSIIGGVKEETEKENPPKYYMRNPPVNDLHPPIVSTAPTSIAETRWMIQPPPSAKVMEGKERVTRSRASSNGSSWKGVDSVPLSRQVVERLVDAKINRESPSNSESLSTNSRFDLSSKLTKLQKFDEPQQEDCNQSGST
ncbi:hypothetical protein GcM3_211013 [Golovinomyces cichoracearum]|uniref:Signal peptide-containing protein n=1 Tax=Golovinomyces cichoracearum TaxID=62708 RepID=A0A420H9Z2_9PEZI|nr:hypothetical protein GcM3_211013 [Golovinomyces cichoracearum]